jgi:chromate transporter
VLAPLAIFAAALAAQYVFKAKTTVVWVVFAAALAGWVLFR